MKTLRHQGILFRILILSSFIVLFFLLCFKLGCLHYFFLIMKKGVSVLGATLIASFFSAGPWVSGAVRFLILALINSGGNGNIMMAAGEGTSGAEGATGAGPQGTATSADGPSSRPQNPDLNLDPNLRQVTEELLDDLESIDRQMDQLIAPDSSFSSKEEQVAYQRELEVLENRLAETKLRLEWVMNKDNEVQAAKEEQVARLKADPLYKKLELEFRQRKAFLSRFPPDAVEQYERDRANRQ
uniref:Uncharacterized protein n=1 Tax=Zelkova schneideriana TaxID=172643 RepID=A0A8F1SRI7_9ROSA|nr:hypothetical protein [Zelkova schneideriana]